MTRYVAKASQKLRFGMRDLRLLEKIAPLFTPNYEEEVCSPGFFIPLGSIAELWDTLGTSAFYKFLIPLA